MTDHGLDALENRVAALEEIIAARWPRSMFLRWRLARGLRSSAAVFGWAGDSFAERRGEAMGEDVAARMLPQEARDE